MAVQLGADEAVWVTNAVVTWDPLCILSLAQDRKSPDLNIRLMNPDKVTDDRGRGAVF